MHASAQQLKSLLQSALLILLAPSLGSTTCGMGTEDFGNKPLNDANFQAWTGVMPVVNDSHRVYHWWVNGNEKFFFKGDTEALNAALVKFAKIDFETLEVVLRPAPGITSAFDQEREIHFNWNLHLIGGIAAGMFREDQGDLIWTRHPVMTIYVGDDISLSKLKIPEAITVSQVGDLQARYAKALSTSTSKTVRGWACGRIAELDRYNSAAMYRIAKKLTDDDPWVRLNAAGAIASFGAKAKPALKQLRAAAETDDKQLSQRAKESIEKIEAAKEVSDREARHVEILKAISKYCDQHSSG